MSTPVLNGLSRSVLFIANRDGWNDFYQFHGNIGVSGSNLTPDSHPDLRSLSCVC